MAHHIHPGASQQAVLVAPVLFVQLRERGRAGCRRGTSEAAKDWNCQAKAQHMGRSCSGAVAQAEGGHRGGVKPSTFATLAASCEGINALAITSIESANAA